MDSTVDQSHSSIPRVGGARTHEYPTSALGRQWHREQGVRVVLFLHPKALVLTNGPEGSTSGETSDHSRLFLKLSFIPGGGRRSRYR